MKELFIRFTASAFRKLPSIYVFSYFPFGFEGRMYDLIVSAPDHCLSFYFSLLLKELIFDFYLPSLQLVLFRVAAVKRLRVHQRSMTHLLSYECFHCS